MRIIRPLHSAGVLFILHAFAGGCAGQVEPHRGSESRPSDVNLTIRTRGGQSVFQIGEMIELELLFTSSAPKKYLAVQSRTDRSCNGIDRVAVAPLSGWDDPLADFYQFCLGVHSCDSLQSTPPLSAKPVVFNLELNEWVRFRDPGKYQVSIESRHAGIAKTKTLLTLNSNRLPLTIVPATEQWQEQTLRSARAVLDKTGSFASVTGEQYTARWQAVNTLRYLGTPAAVREIVRWLKSDDLTSSGSFLLGLVASTARELVLDQMKALLVDPDFPVFEQDLCSTALLSVPPGISEMKAQLDALKASFRDELRSALKNKRGNALEVSTFTVNTPQ